MSDALTGLMAEVAALRRKVERLETLENHNFSALNVGTATGAATGEIRASSFVRANSGANLSTIWTPRFLADLASGATADITALTFGMLLVTVKYVTTAPYYNTALVLIAWDAYNGSGPTVIGQSAGTGTAQSVYDTGATGVVVSKIGGATNVIRFTNNFAYTVQLGVAWFGPY